MKRFRSFKFRSIRFSAKSHNCDDLNVTTCIYHTNVPLNIASCNQSINFMSWFNFDITSCTGDVNKQCLFRIYIFIISHKIQKNVNVDALATC